MCPLVGADRLSFMRIRFEYIFNCLSGFFSEWSLKTIRFRPAEIVISKTSDPWKRSGGEAQWRWQLDRSCKKTLADKTGGAWILIKFFFNGKRYNKVLLCPLSSHLCYSRCVITVFQCLRIVFTERDVRETLFVYIMDVHRIYIISGTWTKPSINTDTRDPYSKIGSGRYYVYKLAIATYSWIQITRNNDGLFSIQHTEFNSENVKSTHTLTISRSRSADTAIERLVHNIYIRRLIYRSPTVLLKSVFWGAHDPVAEWYPMLRWLRKPEYSVTHAQQWPGSEVFHTRSGTVDNGRAGSGRWPKWRIGNTTPYPAVACACIIACVLNVFINRWRICRPWKGILIESNSSSCGAYVKSTVGQDVQIPSEVQRQGDFRISKMISCQVSFGA